MIVIILNRIEIVLLAFAVCLIAFTGDYAMDIYEFIAVVFIVVCLSFGIFLEIDLRRFFAELEKRDEEE